jgi:hypothetical protein
VEKNLIFSRNLMLDSDILVTGRINEAKNAQKNSVFQQKFIFSAQK